MAKLIYSVIASLDGYVADETGNFDWAEPDEEVHAFVNKLERPIGTYLYGRRMYEVMKFWETERSEDLPRVFRDYGPIWRSADKIVYSTTLRTPSTAKTIIKDTFDADAVRRMKPRLDRDLSVGGPTLAAEAMRAELIDEVRLIVVPVVVGGGTPVFLPGVHEELDLVEDHRFGNSWEYLRYATKP